MCSCVGALFDQRLFSRVYTIKPRPVATKASKADVNAGLSLMKSMMPEEEADSFAEAICSSPSPH